MSRSGSVSGGSDTDGETTRPSLSASALTARFEQKATEAAPPKRNFVINKSKTGNSKFNTNSSGVSSKCAVCGKTVYAMEKLEVDGLVFHKPCFKCATCKKVLSAGNYASLEGIYYCKPHLKQLFQLKGNYDEGFGRNCRKADWERKGNSNAESSTPESEHKQEETLDPSPDDPMLEATNNGNVDHE